MSKTTRELSGMLSAAAAAASTTPATASQDGDVLMRDAVSSLSASASREVLLTKRTVSLLQTLFSYRSPDIFKIFFRLISLSKGLRKLVDSFFKKQVKKYLPFIEEKWDKLSYREKIYLLSPITQKRILEARLESERQMLWPELMKNATRGKWDIALFRFCEIKRYGMMIGLDPKKLSEYDVDPSGFNLSQNKLCLYHIQLVFFHNLSLEEVLGLDLLQAKAVSKGLLPKNVRGLTVTQIEALFFGLTREQVNNKWFEHGHLLALQQGFTYEQIKGLLDHQVRGLQLGLTREQVVHDWFTYSHVEAIRGGYTYDSIRGISSNYADTVAKYRMIFGEPRGILKTNLELFREQWDHRKEVLIGTNKQKKEQSEILEQGKEKKLRTEKGAMPLTFSAVPMDISGDDTGSRKRKTP